MPKKFSKTKITYKVFAIEIICETFLGLLVIFALPIVIGLTVSLFAVIIGISR